MPEPTGGTLNAEGNDFALFVEAREQALRDPHSHQTDQHVLRTGRVRKDTDHG
jgi:hypothetical protein